jgi:hypothetical protein
MVVGGYLRAQGGEYCRRGLHSAIAQLHEAGRQASWLPVEFPHASHEGRHYTIDKVAFSATAGIDHQTIDDQWSSLTLWLEGSGMEVATVLPTFLSILCDSSNLRAFVVTHFWEIYKWANPQGF